MSVTRRKVIAMPAAVAAALALAPAAHAEPAPAPAVVDAGALAEQFAADTRAAYAEYERARAAANAAADALGVAHPAAY